MLTKRPLPNDVVTPRVGGDIEVSSLLRYNEAGDGCGSVLIVCDDAVLRGRLASVLQHAGFASLEAGTAEEALEQAEADFPTVLIVDIDLADDKSGYEIYEELRDRISVLPAVFLSGTRTQALDRVAAALLGVDAYLVKPVDPDELITSVRSLVERELERQAARAAEVAAFATLTTRQLEVLRILAMGRSQDEIATILGLSSKTVATHIQYILAKLDVHSRAEAVAMAHTSRLMGPGGSAAAGVRAIDSLKSSLRGPTR